MAYLRMCCILLLLSVNLAFAHDLCLTDKVEVAAKEQEYRDLNSDLQSLNRTIALTHIRPAFRDSSMEDRIKKTVTSPMEDVSSIHDTVTLLRKDKQKVLQKMSDLRPKLRNAKRDLNTCKSRYERDCGCQKHHTELPSDPCELKWCNCKTDCPCPERLYKPGGCFEPRGTHNSSSSPLY